MLFAVHMGSSSPYGALNYQTVCPKKVRDFTASTFECYCRLWSGMQNSILKVSNILRHSAHYSYVCACFATKHNGLKWWCSIRRVIIHRRKRYRVRHAIKTINVCFELRIEALTFQTSIEDPTQTYLIYHLHDSEFIIKI